MARDRAGRDPARRGGSQLMLQPISDHQRPDHERGDNERQASKPTPDSPAPDYPPGARGISGHLHLRRRGCLDGDAGRGARE